MKSRPNPITLTISEIRAIALRAQGLADDPEPFGKGKEAVLRAIEHLGYVQVDPISVVQRAHHHVLWTRVPNYTAGMLDELQHPDVKVFEYWNHATSYLPVRDYRYSLPLMASFRDKLHWSDDSADLEKSMKRMLGAVREGGALRVSDIESEGRVRSGWSTTAVGKIERRALHELWMRGDVMIRSRRGLEKVFDLPERVLPPETDLRPPTQAETAAFHVRRSLRALGIARASELHYLHGGEQASAVKTALEGLVEQGEVVAIQLADSGGESSAGKSERNMLYAFPDALKLAAPLKPGATGIRFLSPFDNAVIQRKRLNWLFDFEYIVEIYVPAAKRKYGYFALPVLHGDRIIGRMDAKAVRAERRLAVHNLIYEPWVTPSHVKRIQPAFDRAMLKFLRFQQCDTWDTAGSTATS